MTPSVDQFITFVYSSDLDRSDAFYGGALGLDVTIDQGVCRIYGISAGSAIGVCSHRNPQPDGIILTLVTDDVDGWFRRIVAHDVLVDGPPRSNDRFGIYHFFATDPDGYQVEVQQFRPKTTQGVDG